ncbi:hypothetical protein IHV12_04895 [Fictibacillus sp. 7GRE50]|uniref:hypothetical protein n=1 Tax=Fictibacillus sp. 7GRE50 TaxID=2745878 RepID=UPI0018CF4301|nr:hypothetical protein [Fictibacillus sp. 7GRE50]MBH0164240.1 hypothetical protein [Fictibacillus sp. 7GRE50]
MVLISVLLAFVYAGVAAVLVKGISTHFFNRKEPYELGFFISAVVLIFFSSALFLLHTPFYIFNNFIKSGIAFGVFQLLWLPILLILKKKNKQTYKKFIQWFEQTL